MSLDQILASFDPSDPSEKSEWKNQRTITIWVPNRHKDAFARLQQTTGRRFGKKLRELIMTAIDVMESKAD